MSSWNTPAGSLGSYSQGQPVIKTLSASPTLGGYIEYFLADGTRLPSNLILEKYGVISGIPTFVSVNTISYFQISATEFVDGVAHPNIQNFSIYITTLIWETPAGSIGSFTDNVPLNYQFVAIPSQITSTITYQLLNGSLPVGTISPVTISSSGLLSGTSDFISQSTVYNFTIRATEYNGSAFIAIRDRTFSMILDIQIPIPSFTTPSGALFTTYDSTWQSFQLQYINQDPNGIVVINVALGILPPGLEINATGLIRGYALPPTDVLGDPVDRTYNFTLQITSSTGRSLTDYSITILNQELVVGFIGRQPTILNTQPLSYIIPSTDVYAPYYLSSSSLGDFIQNSEFIFKIIGYNFDTNSDIDLTYEFNINSGTGITINDAGWLSGLLPVIDQNIITYNFTVSVYKTSTPSLISDTFSLSLTIIGDINAQITWLSDSNLGTINNGAISDLSVLAKSVGNLDLSYRLVGSSIQTNLKTITSNASQFNVFGDVGAYVVGSSNGLTWTSEPNISSPVTFLYFTSSVYDSVNQVTILVGYNQSNNSIIGRIYDDNIIYYASTSIVSEQLNSVTNNSGTYIAVGNNGVIVTTTDISSWTVVPTSGTTNNLNYVYYSTMYIVVGDSGTILTSNDAVTWNEQVILTTLSLRAVIYTGTKYIAVGDLGIIASSVDGIVWTTDFISDFNFKTIAIDTSAYNPVDRILIAGDNGIIYQSIDDGVTWILVQNLISTTNLYNVMFDSVNTNDFYIVGDSGTILIYDNKFDSATYTNLISPTLSRLPPDLILLTDGDISGRLAFESTNSIVNQGVEATYSFSVQAYSTLYPEIYSIKTFSLTTVQKFYLPYDNVYIQALPSLNDRQIINSLLYNGNIIPQEYVYRPTDPYFGVATDVRYQHIYGVPTVAAQDFYTTYVQAVQINHYWRNITLGEIKTAVATDDNLNIIYEVVYSEIIDDLVTNNGVSISKEIIWPRAINLHLNDWITSLTNIYDTITYDPTITIVKTYISSSDGLTLILNSVDGLELGMNLLAVVNTTVTNDIYDAPSIIVSIDPTISSVTVNVVQSLSANQQILFSPGVYTSLTPGIAQTLYPNSLPNMRQQIYDSIGRINDSSFLPTWMTSLQPDKTIPGFTPAWVICYTKPGFSKIVANNIATQWSYTLNQIDFELDRFEVDRSKTYNYTGLNSSEVPTWVTLPSAQPNVVGNDEDKYVFFPRKTILPTQSQD